MSERTDTERLQWIIAKLAADALNGATRRYGLDFCIDDFKGAVVENWHGKIRRAIDAAMDAAS